MFEKKMRTGLAKSPARMSEAGKLRRDVENMVVAFFDRVNRNFFIPV